MSNAAFWPVPKQEFPEAFKKKLPNGSFTLLGAKYACQACESSFELKEHHPTDPNKKSRSWCVGYVVFGKDDPSMVECFIVKCPSCGQPSLIAPVSKRKLASEVMKSAPPTPPPTPPKPANKVGSAVVPIQQKKVQR